MREFLPASASGSVFVLALALCAPSAAHAQVVEPLGSFTGCGPSNTCSANDDGSHPLSALVLAPDGNLYGTTSGEGTESLGTIFRVTPDGVRTVVYNFSAAGGANGCHPVGRLTVGADGALYGVTSRCATSAGTLFRFSAPTLDVLHRFDAAQPYDPSGGMALGADGAFYGPTLGHDGPIVPETGPFFRWDGSFSVLPSPPPLSFGEVPPRVFGDLTRGADGNIYVGAAGGGFRPLCSLNPMCHPCAWIGCGGIYRISGAAVEQVVDGDSPVMRHPQAGLLQHSDGGLYGRAVGGIYRLAPDDSIEIVAPEINALPNLAEGFHGAIYGAARDATFTFPMIFRLDSDRSVTTLHTFDPEARTVSGLTRGADGHFYGSTSYGGEAGFGTLFRLRMPTAVDAVANGRQGPVTVTNGDALSVSFAFHEGATGAAEQAELYVALVAPWGGVYWMNGEGSFSTGVRAVYSGPLPSFAPTPFVSLPTVSGLPSGDYYWIIIVDTDANGVPNGQFADFVKTTKG
jgi:uncharacterized repeat protein (TIGR03803 family)